MNSQAVFDWIIGIGGAIIGWMLKIIWEAIRDLKTEVKDIEHQMHDEFVRRDDFKESIRDIKNDMRVGFDKVDATLGLIFKKLEQKENRN